MAHSKYQPKSQSRGFKISVGIIGTFSLFLSGCFQHGKPDFIFMPNMVYTPALKYQKGEMRLPVKGTVPRGYEPYAYAIDQGDIAGKELKNPLRRTQANLERGQAMFNTYCIVCHGPNGEGDGTIVPKFPRPLSLQSEKVRTWTDGRIYHVIMRGQNLMPSYASQVATSDRWAVIHYLRALQKSKHPTAEDLKAVEVK